MAAGWRPEGAELLAPTSRHPLRCAVTGSRELRRLEPIDWSDGAAARTVGVGGPGLLGFGGFVGWAQNTGLDLPGLDGWMSRCSGSFLEFGYRGSKPEISIIILGTVICYPK